MNAAQGNEYERNGGGYEYGGPMQARPAYPAHTPQDLAQQLTAPALQRLIGDTLGDNARRAFTMDLLTAVAGDPSLASCDPTTLATAAMSGTLMGLSMPAGDFYLLGFEDSRNSRRAARLVLGVNGMVKLALRSGQIKRLTSMTLHAAEFKSWNPLREELQLSENLGAEARTTPVVGYAAQLERRDGFCRTVFAARGEMEEHARRYVRGYQGGRGRTAWDTSFDLMAEKSLLRRLLSRYGGIGSALATGADGDACDAVHFTAAAAEDAQAEQWTATAEDAAGAFV